MKDNGNYFENLNNLFTKAYEEENIVVDEDAKRRVRENLAYKIEKIKLQGWESPLSLFLKDKLRFASVILPLLLIGVFTTFAAVGYIDVPFIGGEKETETNESQEIAMSTVRDTETPERDEGQLIMADILQDELEEDVVEIENVANKTEPILPRNLTKEDPPSLLVLDINSMGKTQYVFEPQASPESPAPQKEDDKSMLAFGDEVFTGGGIDLSFFGGDEESASSMLVEEESYADEPQADESADSNDAKEDVPTESTNDLGDESDLVDDSTQDLSQDQIDDQQDSQGDQDTQDQSQPADDTPGTTNTTDDNTQDTIPPADTTDTTDDSGDDSGDDSKSDDDDKVKPYMVAYLIPQGKELEALNFSNTEIAKLVSDKDVDKVTIEYLEDTKIKVTIENNGLFEYYIFVKDGFAWKEFDVSSVLQNNLSNSLLLEPMVQPLTLNLKVEDTTLAETFKEGITKYNFFK